MLLQKYNAMIAAGRRARGNQTSQQHPSHSAYAAPGSEDSVRRDATDEGTVEQQQQQQLDETDAFLQLQAAAATAWAAARKRRYAEPELKAHGKQPRPSTDAALKEADAAVGASIIYLLDLTV